MVDGGRASGPLGSVWLALNDIDERRFQTISAVLIGLAILARIVVALVLANTDPATAQIWEYGRIAQTTLAAHGHMMREITLPSFHDVVKSAYMPPIGVYLWVVLYWLFGVTRTALVAYLVINVIGASVAVFQVRRIATVVGLPRIGVLAAIAMFGFYPTFVYSAAIYHVINLYIPPLLASLLVAFNLAKKPNARDAIILGALGGIAALIRTEYIVLEAGIFIGAWLTHRSYRAFFLSVLVSFLTIIPWTIRNYVVMDRFIPVANSEGYALWKGFNPETVGSSGDETISNGWYERQIAPTMNKLKPSPNLENEEQDIYLNAALHFIQNHPWRLIPLSINKLILFWGIDWHDPTITLRPAYLLSVIPVSILAYIGILLAMWRGLTLYDKTMFGMFVAQSVAILMYSVQARYRMNVEPALIIYAGYAIAMGVSEFARRAGRAPARA